MARPAMVQLQPHCHPHVTYFLPNFCFPRYLTDYSPIPIPPTAILYLFPSL